MNRPNVLVDEGTDCQTDVTVQGSSAPAVAASSHVSKGTVIGSLGVVAIGRNEGNRLEGCLRSVVGRVHNVVYVDSGSTDGSVELARSLGVEVVELDRSTPFTAARARNVGFERLLQLAPDVTYVQFVDGDCELVAQWLELAEKTLDQRQDHVVVCGRRRERFSDASVYNRLCDIEWDTPVGETRACGGDAMMRVEEFRQAGGYDPALIAGEEPELCVRLRRAGGRILRIDADMTLHDAALTSFRQWWKRAARGGHAYLEGAYLHGLTPQRHCVRQTLSALFWAAVVPCVSALLAWPTGGLSLLLLLVYPLQWLRLVVKGRRRGQNRADSRTYALFTILAKFAEMSGMFVFGVNRVRGKRTRLIEYQPVAESTASRARPMKVAYLATEYPKTTHSFIRREIAGLEKCGMEVLPMSLRPSAKELPEKEDRDERARTFVVLARGALGLILDMLIVALCRPVAWLRAVAGATRLGWRSYSGLLRHLIYFAESCAVVRHLRRQEADHIHAHFGTNATTVAMLARVLGGPPYSFTIHGPGEWDSPELLHLKDKVARARFVAAITDFARGQTYRWADPGDWKKVHVVRCGVDGRFLDTPVEPVPEQLRLVCVGRLGRSKGHVLLIEAAGRLRREGLRFEITLVGDGPLRVFFEKLVREQGLQETLRFAGWMDGAAVHREILASRALVLPSFGEGLPVVIMESFALARPVISTRIAGIPELVVSGENGWLITSGSVEELTNAMREALLASPDHLLSMGQTGRRSVLEKHDSLKEAEKIARLITDLSPEASARGVTQPPGSGGVV